MKPCHTESSINGVMHICNRPHSHTPPHVFELFKHDEAREPVGFSNTVGLGIVDPVEALKKIASGCTTDPAATAQHALDSMSDYVPTQHEGSRDEGKYIKCEICLLAFSSDEAFNNHSSAQHRTFTPEEARALWQVASRTPGSVASEPLESALAKLLPMAEADGARRKYLGNGCLWVRP